MPTDPNESYEMKKELNFVTIAREILRITNGGSIGVRGGYVGDMFLLSVSGYGREIIITGKTDDYFKSLDYFSDKYLYPLTQIRGKPRLNNKNKWLEETMQRKFENFIVWKEPARKHASRS